MAVVRHDRIFSLAELKSYPGSDVLDMVFYLPKPEGGEGAAMRRVWLMTEGVGPRICIDDVELFGEIARQIYAEALDQYKPNPTTLSQKAYAKMSEPQAGKDVDNPFS